ncbi:MAG TPA: PqqD family protein [Pyrinomonadaceae bacterium]
MDVLDSCFVKGDDIVTRHIAGETLIVPVRGHVGDLDSIYTLNEVGSRVWQLIDGGTPVSRIVNAIRFEYEVSEPEASRDVLELFESLQSAGLIRRAGESEG